MVIILLCIFKVHGQFDISKNNITLTLKAGASAGNNMPFWQRVNQYGEIPDKGPFFQAAIDIQYDSDTLQTLKKEIKPWGTGYGFRLAGNQTFQNTQILLPEAFVKVRRKRLEFYGGRRKEIFGLVDTLGTSGSYIWSGNALPIPKLQLHTPAYVPLGKKGIVSIKGGISHGWFGKDSVVQGHWLHQKWLYGKLGNKNLQVFGGINHQVMWGGYSELLRDVQGLHPPTINGYLAPSPSYSYQYLLIPFLQKLKSPDPLKVPSYDGGLAIGNQLGSVDIGMQFFGKTLTFFIYKQQAFDFARSIVHLNNIEDGLHGVSITLKKSNQIHHIVLEYFNSKSQGRFRFGKYMESNFGEVDNYFFHGQYQNWAYQNRILGTPFIQSVRIGETVSNNRVQYIYLKLTGKLQRLNFQIQNVLSRNYGLYSSPLNAKQWSGHLQIIFPHLNHRFNLSLAADAGSLFSPTFGTVCSYAYLIH